jgi:hypothetical protein
MRVPITNATVFRKVFDQTARFAAQTGGFARLMRSNGTSITFTRKNSLIKATPAPTLEAWPNHAPLTSRHMIP